MQATYNPIKADKQLNVREQPNSNASVLRTMKNGDSEEVEIIEHGWCKLHDGYVDVRFLTVTPEHPATTTNKTGGSSNTETVGSDDGKTIVEDHPADDGNVELRKMTNPQLYDLAENSGIKVKKNMNKDALIEAILAGAND